MFEAGTTRRWMKDDCEKVIVDRNSGNFVNPLMRVTN